MQILNLKIPDTTKAILFDMDGVLVDSLGLDINICNNYLPKIFGPEVEMGRDFIRSIFAYAPNDFCQLVLQEVAYLYPQYADKAMDYFEEFCIMYNTARETEPFPKTPNVEQVFKTLKEQGLQKAVVSNNHTSALEAILTNCDLIKEFPIYVGNDLTVNGQRLRKKPAPDTYIHAANLLGLDPKDCVVVEDSTTGAEAGKAAGCHVIGVATGSATLPELTRSPYTDQAYSQFELT